MVWEEAELGRNDMRTHLFAAAVTSLVALSTPACPAESWQQAIAAGLGKTGTELPGGVYRVGLPRTDLKVMLDGVEIKPALALGSWLAFRSTDKEVIVMGDLVLTQEEVNPVMTKLEEGGVEVTALHNHLLRAVPNPMYMHVHGHGDPGKLAAALHAALTLTKTPFGTEDAGPSATQQTTTTGNQEATIDLDTTTIERTLGAKGKVTGGVYQMTAPRAETVRVAGIEVPASMGSAIAINFQPTEAGKAAITGDFVLTADEVSAVAKTLRANEIEVTAIHNHMLGDEPRLFFMHFWAKDDARKLAKGLRAALDHVKTAK